MSKDVSILIFCNCSFCEGFKAKIFGFVLTRDGQTIDKYVVCSCIFLLLLL